jgi:glyoxylase-like metal-dependent hydrolase (beta-lactamase superfamily II)
MQILTNTGGIFATNAYLIADETSNDAILFDAPDHTVAPLLTEAKRRGWNVRGIWLTHGHIDHIADHAAVTDAFPDARILIHPLDQPKLRSPNSLFPLPFSTPSRGADELLSDGQRLHIGSIDVDVIHTPGHSPGHVMFHLPSEHVLVGGDLIIMGAVGRTDLPDSNHADLLKSIRRVMALPPQTRLLGGHGATSTLAEERANNPYVQQALASV